MGIRKNFSLNRIAEYLKTNKRNSVQYINKKGEIINRTFNLVYKDALIVMKKLNNAGIKRDSVLGILGANSYYWLIVEVACIFSGIETIALPENFSDIQVKEFITRYKIQGIALEEEISIKNIFLQESELFKIFLNDELFEEEQQYLETSEDYFKILSDSNFKIKVFTSGTTSKIKSFSIYKESTEAMIKHFIEFFKLNESERWLICHPFSHYSHLEYALGGLCAGYDIIISDLTSALAYFSKFKPSVFISVPASYYYFYEKLQNVIEEDMSQEEKMESAKKYFGGNMKVFVIGAAPSRQVIKDYFMELGLPLYEGYGLTETGMVAVNAPENYKKGTVGKVFPGVKVYTDSEDTICIVNEVLRMKEYDNYTESENKEVFPREKEIITGDLGYVDNDGYIFINGRRKDIIITNGGKKLNAIEIEDKLSEINYVRQCIIVGNDRPFLVAIIVIENDNYETRNSIIQEINEINKSLGEHEKVRDYIFTSEDFSEENNLMTRSHKIIRSAVEKRYCEDINKCYI